jgi:hypothetical protein
MKSEIVFRLIKITDIAYISAIYATVVIAFSVMFNNFVGEVHEEEENKKSLLRVVFETWIYIGIIAITAYIIRNIVELIPFPLDGVGGFVHSRVKELRGGPIYGFLLFFYASNLRKKIELIIKRIKI